MKLRSYIFIIGVFLTGFCSAQTYSFLNGTTYSVTLDTSVLFYTKGIELTNTGTVNLNLSWELTYKDTLNDCRFELCNSGQCYNNLPLSGNMPVVNPGNIGFLKMHVFTGKTQGRNVVKYVLKNGASQIDTLTFVAYVAIASGLPELKNNSQEIFIYPSPAVGFVNISGIKPYNTEIQVFNVTGHTVLHYPLNEQKNRIDTHNLPSGIYFYKITENDNIVKSGKLLINSN